MFHDTNWRLAGDLLPGAATVLPVEAALVAFHTARRDLELSERADLIALHRVAVLRDWIAACTVDEGDAELGLAAAALAEELASHEETLPLERAFRADQRDAALIALAAAQDRLRALAEDAPDGRIAAALAAMPQDIARAARLAAEAGIACAPVSFAPEAQSRFGIASPRVTAGRARKRSR